MVLAIPRRAAARVLPLACVRFLPHGMPGVQIGFLGISYVTFRSLDVVFGIRDRLISSLPAGEYFAFLFFFPTISSGPIDRYRRFRQDWNRPRLPGEFWKDLDGAVHRIFTGFLFKFILAAAINTYWLDQVTPGGLLNTLSYMYGYSLYLYFDFAGYTLSPSASATCWESTRPKTSSAPSSPRTSKTSGIAGTSASLPGSAIMCT